LLAGWPFRQPWLRRQASSMLAATKDEIVDCGAGVRLLGHFSPQATNPRGLVILLHGWEGSAAASYVLSTGGWLYEAGFDVFRTSNDRQNIASYSDQSIGFALRGWAAWPTR